MNIFLKIILYSVLFTSGLWTQLHSGAYISSLFLFETDIPASIGHTGWFTVSDSRTNAFFLWRWDPIWEQLAGFDAEAMRSLIHPISITLIFTGFTVLFTVTGSGFIPALLKSFTGSLLFLLVTEGDPVALSSICWIPLLFSLLQLPRYSPKTPFLALFIVLLFLFLRLIQSANQFAPFILLAAALPFIFSPRESAPSNRWSTAVIPPLLLLFALTLSAMVPFPAIPDYPVGGKVVPDDGIPGIIRPLITGDSPVPIIDRWMERSLFQPVSLYALIAGLIALVISLRTNAFQKQFLYSALILFLTAVADTSFSEPLAQIFPLQTLRRILPGGMYVSFLPFTLILGVFFFLYTLFQKFSFRYSTIPFLILFSGYLFHMSPGQTSAICGPDMNNAYCESRTTSTQRVQNPKFNISPSRSILQEFGEARFFLKKHSTEIVLQNTELQVRASHHNKKKHLKSLKDNNAETRWGTGLGKQIGSEWVLFRFHQPKTLTGISIDTGIFAADFPRGVQVTAINECQEDEPYTNLLKQGITVFQSSDWKGPLRITSDGYPYYGPQQKGEFLFDQERTVQCILIQQIGKTSVYEWSIARVSILITKDFSR